MVGFSGVHDYLKKSHLVEQKGKILGHMWDTGGYWTPSTFKLEELSHKTHDEYAHMNCSSLYCLLNFYHDYVPHFAELTEPICRLLGHHCMDKRGILSG